MSKMWTLDRFAYLPLGTLGRLSLDGGSTLYTLERPWLNNEPYISCIPEGDYQLEWDTTGRIKGVPRLCRVEDRSQINIHVANHVSELHGCIGVGMDWAVTDKLPSIQRSREAMSFLLDINIGLGVLTLDDGDPLHITLAIESNV